MDKYKVIKFLNQGSFGKIYLVERHDCQQQFAMKTIKLAGIDRYQRSSILTEVKILLTNSSEFLLRCYDLFVHRQRLCIITEYIDGGDLDQYIKDNKAIDPETITRVFLKVCVGINAMHANSIMHRDIKPANILITKTGDIKICDFGICKMLEYTKVATTMVGTPYFMSPEQMNHRHYDCKSDIWGIGCVLYSLLYNRYPFSGRTLHDLKKNVRTKDPFVGINPRHNALHNIVKEMLDKNKGKRPDLATFLGDASNRKLMAHHGIRYQASPFRKYTLQSIPSNEREWCSTVDKLRKDFCLPALLHDRTQEILRETRLPTAERSLPDITPYAEIRREHAPQPVVRPTLPRVRPPPRQPDNRAMQHAPPPPCKPPNARPSVARSSMARRNAPRQVQHSQPSQPVHRRTPAMGRPPTPLYRPAPQVPARSRPVTPALRKHEPLLNYLRNKDYPPRERPSPPPRPPGDRLPRVRNRYKNVQSKVKKYWA